MGSKKNSSDKQKKQDRSDSGGSSIDKLKWLAVFAIIICGVVANIHYSNVSGAIRAAIGLVGFLVLLAVFFSTQSGTKSWTFIKGSQTEMRKVTWPTRPEAMQMTMIVMIVLIITSLVLWFVDGLFLRLVGLLTGQGG